MKKFLLMMALLFSFIAVNAQTAIEESKVFDNTYVGVTAGAMTPLDFNSVFPVNTVVGLKIGKEITPVVGFEVEGLASFNDNHFGDFKTGIKATNLDAALTLNLNNLFAGYNGKPRPIEFKTNTGIGWLHTYGDINNALTAKTTLDVVWNIGNKRAISVIVSPGVYWNLNSFDGAINNIKFNKHHAQFALMGSLVWHFKTSNGTRYFKKYDVSAMISEIDRLNEELAKKPTEVEKVVEKVVVVEKAPTAAVAQVTDNITYVFFAQNSDALTDDAKKSLDTVSAGEYNIDGYASPEGTDEYNMQLSKRRAEAVADYLTNKGIIIKSVEGHGVAFGDATNRMVTITKK